jgi:hypothetical protein
MTPRDREREAESRRIIERLASEAESSGVTGFVRARLQRDGEDWAEYWGTRIGRVLGFLIMVIMLSWLALLLVRG